MIRRLIVWWRCWWGWGVTPWQHERDIKALKDLAECLREARHDP